MEDEKIIQALFRREEAGLSAIESAYGEQLHRIALRVCGNRQDAEEVINDTLSAVWDAIPPEHPRVLFSYIARITRNLSCNALRRSKAEKRVETVPFDEVMEELLPAFDGEDETAAESDRAAIGSAINVFLDRCNETDRTIFIRRYFYAEPVQDVARAVGLTRETTSQRLLRMRKSLKDVLKARGVHL